MLNIMSLFEESIEVFKNNEDSSIEVKDDQEAIQNQYENEVDDTEESLNPKDENDIEDDQQKIQDENDFEEESYDLSNLDFGSAEDAIKEISASKTSNSSKAKAKAPKKTSESKAKNKSLSFNEKLEKELKNYTRVEVKIWGSQVFVIEEQSEIESIKLNDLQNKLVSMGFEEFRGTGNIVWNSIPNEEKTQTILMASIKFHAKG